MGGEGECRDPEAHADDEVAMDPLSAGTPGSPPAAGPDDGAADAAALEANLAVIEELSVH